MVTNGGYRPNFTSVIDLQKISRMPRLGKIRLGKKAISQKTGNEYPVETDYLVVPPEVAVVYGPEPKEVDVMLPTNDITEIFPYSYTWFGQSKGVKCQGNGDIAARYDEEKKKWVEHKCPCEKLEAGECSLRGMLRVILYRVDLGGVYQIDTGSINSVIDIKSGIEHVQKMLGFVAFVPLKLKRIPRTTHHDGKKQDHYTLHLHLAPNADLFALKENALKELSRGITYQLPKAEFENPEQDEGAEIITVADEEPTPPQAVPEKPRDPKKNGKRLRDFPQALEQLRQKIEAETVIDDGVERTVNMPLFLEYLQSEGLLEPDEEGELDPGNMLFADSTALTRGWGEKINDYWRWVGRTYPG